MTDSPFSWSNKRALDHTTNCLEWDLYHTNYQLRDGKMPCCAIIKLIAR